MIVYTDLGNQSLFIMIATGGIIAFIILTISMLILFVRRLIHVYKSLEFVDRSFAVEAITRVMVLTSISLLMTLLDALTWITGHLWLDKFPRALSYVLLLDIYTNFLCVGLSYTVFKMFYNNWCSYIDKCCRNCWIGLIDCYDGNKGQGLNSLKHGNNNEKTRDMTSAHIDGHNKGLQLQVIRSETITKSVENTVDIWDNHHEVEISTAL